MKRYYKFIREKILHEKMKIAREIQILTHFTVHKYLGWQEYSLSESNDELS